MTVEFLAVTGLVVGDVEDTGLHRCEPQGEGPGVVLDEHADEAFQGPHQSAVNHDRLMVAVVGPGKVHLEAFRQVEVHLDGGALPGPAQLILDLDVDLRPVEDAFAGIDHIA